MALPLTVNEAKPIYGGRAPVRKTSRCRSCGGRIFGESELCNACEVVIASRWDYDACGVSVVAAHGKFWKPDEFESPISPAHTSYCAAPRLPGSSPRRIDKRKTSNAVDRPTAAELVGLRERFMLRQKHVAQLGGVSQGQVSNAERATGTVCDKTLAAYAVLALCPLAALRKISEVAA